MVVYDPVTGEATDIPDIYANKTDITTKPTIIPNKPGYAPTIVNNTPKIVPSYIPSQPTPSIPSPSITQPRSPKIPDIMVTDPTENDQGRKSITLNDFYNRHGINEANDIITKHNMLPPNYLTDLPKSTISKQASYKPITQPVTPYPNILNSDQAYTDKIKIKDRSWVRDSSNRSSWIPEDGKPLWVYDTGISGYNATTRIKDSELRDILNRDHLYARRKQKVNKTKRYKTKPTKVRKNIPSIDDSFFKLTGTKPIQKRNAKKRYNKNKKYTTGGKKNDIFRFVI